MAAPRAILLASQVQAMKLRYEEKDSRGRRVNSIIQIAKEFAVSETTALRAIKSLGAYMAAPEPLPDAGPEMEASVLRLQNRMRAELAAGGLSQKEADGLLKSLATVPVVPAGQVDTKIERTPGDPGYE